MKTQVIYGFHAVISALERQCENVLSVHCQENKRDPRFIRIDQAARNADLALQSASAATLNKLAQSEHHQGFVATIRAVEPKTEKDLLAWLETTERTPLLLIIEGLEDPHNVGACLRSAEALGVDWVIMPRSRSVSASATISKVSCGADQRLPVVMVANVVRCIEQIQKRGVWVMGTSGPVEGVVFSPIHAADFTRSLAIVMGGESEGLRRLTREACDGMVGIPLVGMTESLNVSVATGICLYECVRQRQMARR